MKTNPTAALAVLTLVVCTSACRQERSVPTDASSGPARVELRHRFVPGTVHRYESKTTEQGFAETTVELRYTWKVTGVRPSGAGEIQIGIEHYRYRVFPAAPAGLPRDANLLNKGLAGARFELLVPSDGRGVKHLGQAGVPDVSPASLETLRMTLESHVLRLPQEPVSSGKRWTVERSPAADAGPGSVKSLSRWRVLSVRRTGTARLVELVCLSTMEPAVVLVKGRRVASRTEFHYSYLWDATGGVLEGLTSRGETVVKTEAGPDAGTYGEPRSNQFVGSLRLLRER